MADLHLVKPQAITSPKHFDDVFRRGNRIASQHILLLSVACKELGLAFAVSRRIRGAVKRNRAKRRLREVARLHRESLPRNSRIILMAKPGIEKVEFDRLTQEFLDLLQKMAPGGPVKGRPQ